MLTWLLRSRAALFITALSFFAVGEAAAQSPSQTAQAQAILGGPITRERVAEAIRQSGLSQAQIRERLAAAGHNPALADSFFVAGAANASAPPATDFVRALQSLGILGVEAPVDTVPRPVSDPRATDTSAVFGKSVFNRASTAFDPVTSGPVDPGYRIGVGDQLQLVFTGEIEAAYALEVRRDGSVVVPQIGQITVAGLTLEGARALLRQRAGVAYSGLRSGLTRMDLAIGQLRTNAVFVVGEVEHPGAYQVSGLATTFHALARAGGPTERGSFRAVELRRGGAVVRQFDLYAYLLGGDASRDVRLEQGDVIFVPLNTRAVTVTGAVRRQKQFELLANEGFNDLIRFAGGFEPSASLERIQIDRMLPPEQRSPGFERVKIDVRMGGNAQVGQAFPLLDGDVVTVFGISKQRRNVVQIDGAVHQPGEYEFRTGMTLGALLASAQGYLPTAMRDRLLIHRFIPTTGRMEALTVPTDSAGAMNYPLAEFDSVTVMDVRRDFPDRNVVVTGAVNAPNSFPYFERETLRELIDRAGGFREGAQTVDLARRRVGAQFSDTTSTVTSFTVADFRAGGRADAMVLQPFDRVDVRLSPGYRDQRFVRVIGEFVHPGVYAINEHVDRLGDLVRRAGGTLPQAHAASFQLRRQGSVVNVDFARALRGDRVHNVVVRDGDELFIAADPQVVRVQGAVMRPSLIRYQRGLSVLDYIELAGGPAERGEAHRAVVDYPSGGSQRVRRRLGLFTSQPPVESGSVITVPAEPVEAATSGTDILGRTVQVTTTLASLIIAYIAATR